MQCYNKRRGVKMNKLKINGIYKHFKGNYYLVVDTANTQKQEKNVLSIELYMELMNYG